MIHYELRCSAGHGFDGWFPSSAAFDRQAGLGLLGCPVCSSSEVGRAVMAPRVASGHGAPVVADAAAMAARPEPGAAKAVSGPGMTGQANTGRGMTGQAGTGQAGTPALPDQMRAMLQRVRAAVEQTCDYVGPRFADEARAIHEGASDKRAIYGETTPAEAEALAEDGIEVSRIPWIPRADS